MTAYMWSFFLAIEYLCLHIVDGFLLTKKKKILTFLCLNYYMYYKGAISIINKKDCDEIFMNRMINMMLESS